MEEFLMEQKPKINEFYKKERKFLLKSIIFIFVYDSCQDLGSGNPVSDVIKHMVTKDILKTIVECLKGNVERQPDKRRDNTEKQQFLYQIMEEEELLIQCILSILISFNQDIKDCEGAKFELFEYFMKSNFQGYFYYRDPETVVTEEFEKVFKKDYAIRDLTIFAALFCLSVNVRDLKISAGLGKILNSALILNQGTIKNLMSLTAYVVAISSCKNLNVDAQKIPEINSKNLNCAVQKSSDKNIIESMVGLLDSHILNEKDYSFIKGPLINVVKQWIDKAYSIDIIKGLEDQNQIKEVCYKLIKEPFILSEFWKFDFNQQTPFFELIKSEYLLGFPQEIGKFSKISYFLTGNNDVDFTQNVIEFYRNFDSLVIPLEKHFIDESGATVPLIKKRQFAGEGEYDFEITQDLKYPLRIPKGTQVRNFPLRREFYELKINYDLWPVLFTQWAEILQRSNDRDISEDTLKYIKHEIKSVSSFISQILIINPKRIEDLSIDTNYVVIEKNLNTIVELLLQSMNQLKVLDQILKDDREYTIEGTLKAISLIINAVGSLYTQPSYRNPISE